MERTESVVTQEFHFVIYKAALLQSGDKNQVIMSDLVRAYYVLGAILCILCVFVHLTLVTLSLC